MPNNDDQLQQQYQEILNKYASSLTPPPPTETPINPILEIPVQTPQLVTFPIVDQPKENIIPPIVFSPEPKPKSGFNFFKLLFFISLLIFIVVASVVIYNFTNQQQALTPDDTTPTPTVVATQFCEVGDNKYNVGETFPTTDSCNTCTCNSDLTVICTEKACNTDESILGVTSTPVKKVATKTYKDIKYGYQFQCPTTVKYQIIATSIDGNKIPFKQESCTDGESVTTISVYDNTVVHSFGNIQTQISPNKKYIFTIKDDNDTIISSFKFL